MCPPDDASTASALLRRLSNSAAQPGMTRPLTRYPQPDPTVARAAPAMRA